MAIPAWNQDARRARIKAIKAMTGRKGLALDDATYRAMLGNVVPGKASAADMSVPQLDAVIVHLKRLTDPAAPAVPKKGDADEWRFVFKCLPDRQAHLRKIYRLAERCGKLLAPPVPVASKGWVEGTAAQMVGCTTALEFCDPDLLHKIVQAFEIHCKRHGV